MNINTLGGIKSEKTFVYEVVLWDFVKKKLMIIEAAGPMEIGRSKPMTQKIQLVLRKILSPYKRQLSDLEIPKFADIGLLIGTDFSSLQVTDHKGLNGLSQPKNLKFHHSPVMAHPVAVG